jgi:hypothetical protein
VIPDADGIVEHQPRAGIHAARQRHLWQYTRAGRRAVGGQCGGRRRRQEVADVPAGRDRLAFGGRLLLPVEGGDDSLERRRGRHILFGDARADVPAQGGDIDGGHRHTSFCKSIPSQSALPKPFVAQGPGGPGAAL